jgi:hypothetical protein
MDDDDNDWGVGPGYPPPQVLGLKRAPQLPRVSDLLLREAESLLQKHDDNSHRLAVILSHAACDVQMEDTMAQLLVSREVQYLDAPMKAVLGNQISLHIGRVRAFYTALSGENPMGQPWWSQWTESIKRRNAVAHGGHVVSPDEATQALNACRECVQHLQAVTSRHAPPAWVSATT